MTRARTADGGGATGRNAGWPLRRRLLLLYLTAALLGLAGGAGAIASLVNAGHATGVIASRLGPAQVDSARLGQYYRDIETNLRTYLTTADAAAARPVLAAQRQASDLAAELRALVANEPTVVGAVDHLDATARDWISKTVAPALSQPNPQPGRALSDDDIARFSTVRDQMDGVTTALAARVESEERRAHDANVTIARFLAIGAGLVLALGIGAFVLLHYSLSVPLDALVARIGAVAAGQLDEPIPAAGPAELASVGAAAEHMRQRLLDDAAGRVNSALIAGQESERRRIAGDIHDDPVQAMTAASLRLQQLRRRLPEDDELRRLTVTAEDATNNATARLRRMIFELYSPVLESEGLVSAIEVYIDETFEDAIESHISGTAVDLPPAVAAVAYRLTRESLWNTFRHAEATRVDVSVRQDADGIEVTVADDGRGFDPALQGAPERGHLGMEYRRELAEAAGGWWKVDSRQGAGTRVTFRLPTEAVRSSPTA